METSLAGRYRPEGSLSDFDGENASGTWTLRVTDDRNKQEGTLNSWSIEITPDQPPVPTLSIGNSTVVEGNTTTRFLDDFVPSGAGGLNSPKELIFGHDANGDGVDDIYVASSLSNSVLRYDGVTGAPIDEFVVAGSGGLSWPASLSFGPDYGGDTAGDLYVGSRASDEVKVYDGTTGAFLGDFVSVGSGGLDEPVELIFHNDGFLYVSSRSSDEILRYDSLTGDFDKVFVNNATGTLGSLGGLAVANVTSDPAKYETRTAEGIHPAQDGPAWRPPCPHKKEVGSDANKSARPAEIDQSSVV